MMVVGMEETLAIDGMVGNLVKELRFEREKWRMTKDSPVRCPFVRPLLTHPSPSSPGAYNPYGLKFSGYPLRVSAGALPLDSGHPVALLMGILEPLRSLLGLLGPAISKEGTRL